MATNQKSSTQKPASVSQPANEMARTEPRLPSARGSWPLSRLRSEFDRLFDDFFRGWPTLATWPDEPTLRWGVAIEDEADKVTVRAEAPGFEPQDFDLRVNDNQLELCACQSDESSQNGGRQWHKQELYRSIPLPTGIDPEHVDAQYHNGILTVTVPKSEQAKGRKVEVKG